MRPISNITHAFVVVTALVAAGPAFGAQPLPRGKARFTVTVGNFDTIGYTWNRIGNWSFDAAAGTVGATYWTWDSNSEKGKTIFNSHRCTFDGITKICNTYTPTGWMFPAGQYVGWTGTYTYNTGTGVLDISWSTIGGVTTAAAESWTVTLPEAGIARVSLISSNYTLTHGRGYGSNASWSIYKTMPDVPRIYYPGKSAGAGSADGINVVLSPTTPGAWKTASLDLSSFHSPSWPTNPFNALHAWLPTSQCTGACQTTRTGIIYHLASNNNGRSMAYNNWCACLPSNAAFPCYTGQMHPSAFLQIIDDSGAMRGMVGIHQQDEPGSAGYSYHVFDFSNVSP